MKLIHWTTLLALLALLGLAVGCEEEAEETSETPTAEAPPEGAEAAEEAAAEVTGEGEAAAQAVAGEGTAEGTEQAAGGDGVCGRAATCCEAYVNALSANQPGLSVEQTCASVRSLQNAPGSDTACQNAISGWRQGLEAAQVDVPGPCQGEQG